ncbi:hypothetical protein [Thorsellia kenyensis]|uniref:Uncharacterized protein n=1 Tax=Thorsellia kenyensis TaxID=1549888 RepID=A0ABV6C7M7_9GAMM
MEYGQNEVKEIVDAICEARNKKQSGSILVGNLYKKDSDGCYRMFLVDNESL